MAELNSELQTQPERPGIDTHALNTHSAKFEFNDYDSQCEPTLLYRQAVEVVRPFTKSEIRECSHRFTPQGYSIILSVPELFLAIHTWPELGLLTVDAVSADSDLARKVTERLRAEFAWVSA